MALKKYGFKSGAGLYTDMNAIRRDEELDNLHSIYVDQWDWERILEKEDRNIEFLKMIVGKIFKVFRLTQEYICGEYPALGGYLPDDISFITTQDLRICSRSCPKQRETG